VPQPAAPEYLGALVSHQRYWEEIWAIQRERGDDYTTMTPEFGPDGYLHCKPFTGEPVADLWAINSWMEKNEYAHFHDWHERMG
jgi:hypothetical protein